MHISGFTGVCVLEQKLEHSFFKLQLQKELTRNGNFSQYFKITKFKSIGTFHFLIANSKRIDNKLEKNSNLSKL
jgi:hypothetical protein